MNLNKTRSSRACRGFTLVELLTVVAIAGVLSSIAVSFFGRNSREEAFVTMPQAVITATITARSYAIGTGTPACMTLENNAITAFVDVDGDHVFGAADTLLYRYPEDVKASLLDGHTVQSVSLKELGDRPQTAFFDGRGFYIDDWSGLAAHDSNICIQDAQTGRQVNVQLSRFGWAGITDTTKCGAQPICAP